MIGITCSYIPIQVIKGFGEEFERIKASVSSSESNAHLSHNICFIAKSIYSKILKGGYEAVIMTSCCDAMRRAAENLQLRGNKVLVLHVPRKDDENAVKYFAAQLRKLVKELEGILNKKFKQVRECGPVKKIDSGGILVNLTQLTPQTDKVIEIIKETGMRAIINSCSDYRTSIRVRKSGNYFTALARACLNKIPCSRMLSHNPERILKLVREVDGKGVINISPKFCDNMQYDKSLLSKALKDEGVPFLAIDVDELINEGQLKTRIQAFKEMLE